MRKLSIVFLCLCVVLLPLWGRAAEDREDSEESLRWLLSEETGREDFAVFEYGDYDGDGLYEAFAFQGKKSEDGFYIGQLWYVSPIRCQPLLVDEDYQFLSLKKIGVGAPMLFRAEQSYGGSKSRSFLWGVSRSQAVDLSDRHYEGVTSGEIAGEFYMYLSAFDIMTDGTGHTYKPYYFFLDDDLVMKEYGGIEISEQDLRMFKGADEILAEREGKGYRLINIIYRANHIININFRDGSRNRYVTVRYDDDSVTFIEEDDGHYEPAGNPSIAVYPEGFVQPSAEDSTGQTDIVEENYQTSAETENPEVTKSPREEFFDWFDKTPEPSQSAAPQVTPAPAPSAIPEPGPDIEYPSIAQYTGSFSVEASSHKLDDSVPDRPSDAFDSSLKTVWCTNNRIQDEWLRLSVQDGQKYMIGGMRIAAGFWYTQHLFDVNASPRHVQIFCDDAIVQEYELARGRDYQTLWFDRPVAASRITLVLKDGYQPNKRDFDCCITEVEILGPGGRQLTSSTIADWGKAVVTAEKRINAGGYISRGDYGMAALGLQVLLKDGFGVLSGAADGSFGPATQAAVDALADRMRSELPQCERMTSGVVDGAYWRNMLKYMDFLNE